MADVSTNILKRPLLISWALTHRCNQRCLYCKIWKRNCRELGKKQVFSIIDQLSALGTILICFSGGEPLIREDSGDILEYTHKKGILFDISTNGFFVKKRLKQIKNARLICLSLDGPAGIHDIIKKAGSYSRAIDSAILLKRENIPVYFRTVLSKINLESIDYILKLALKLKIKVIFQPVTRTYYGSGKHNEFMPLINHYRAAIGKLIKEKESGNPYIQNSLKVLDYFKKWPFPAQIPCVSGKIFFHISPDGKFYPCIWGKNLRYLKAKSCLKQGIAKAIESISEENCEGCWDAAACNFNFSFFDSIANPKKTVDDINIFKVE